MVMQNIVIRQIRRTWWFQNRWPFTLYQKFMKGMDFSDQMVQYYLIHQRSWTWCCSTYFFTICWSASTISVVAKSVLGDAAAKSKWPSFQHFVEDVTHQLTTTTITRTPPDGYVPWMAMLDQKIEWIFGKRKVYSICKQKSGDQCPGATRFGHVRCKEPCNLHCQAEHLCYHNIHEDGPPKDGHKHVEVGENEAVAMTMV